MNYFFKIGELSDLYGIGTDTIRYYEEQGLITPSRGENGYRLYNIRDIWRMNVIRDLRSLGFSVPRIKEYLNNRSLDSTKDLLDEELSVIKGQIRHLNRMQANVEDRIKTLEMASHQNFEVIEKVRIPDRKCHEIAESFTLDEEMDVLIKQLINRNKDRLYIIGSNKIGSRIAKSSIEEGHAEICAGAFLIDPDGDTSIPGGEYLTLHYRGNTSQTPDYIEKMQAAAKAQGYHLAGDVLELVWVDIHEASDMREHISELQFPIAKD